MKNNKIKILSLAFLAMGLSPDICVAEGNRTQNSSRGVEDISVETDSLLPYKNPLLSAEERARDLLKRMTLEEKISQMQNTAIAVERLGIVEYDWWNEALHGVARAGKATVFPQAIGMAASFDADAVYKVFDMVSDEARAKHHEFKRHHAIKRYQGLTFWTPNVNIFRDPRWGRGQETYGEDPYLTTVMGLAVVKGLQGDPTSKYDKLHACAKHYAVHSGPEWNRHSYDAKNISPRDLWETYLPAFKALVEQGGVKEVMCAYNRFEGEPCCSSDQLLMHILREEWGFDGIVVSDCGAIDDFYQKGHHETHKGPADASADAVLTGTDIVCGNTYRSLGDAVKQGLIKESEIDKSVLRILEARFELGLFDADSLVNWSSIPYSVVECREHVEQAREMARKSMVLLENKDQVLPLRKDMKIAVLGPNADNEEMLWANYNGIPTESITILEGITAKLESGNIIYDPSCFEYVEQRVFTDELSRCFVDGKTGIKASFWNNTHLSGPVAADTLWTGDLFFTTRPNKPFVSGVNITDFSASFETTFIPSRTDDVVLRISGDDGYRVFVDGEEIYSDWRRAKKRNWEYVFPVKKDNPVPIKIEYYHERKGTDFSVDLGYASQLDYEAIAARVKDADAIVYVGGMSAKIEGEELSRISLPGFKSGDRTKIELPDVQKNMLKALKKTGKPVVLVICSGSSIGLSWEQKNLDGILAAWYPGQQGGNAVADVLFGDYNPAGRLPLTFYASVGDLPDFEDYDMTKGRTYRYFKGKPVYPFGYGLSYTTFKYGKASVQPNKDGGATLTIPVRNMGDRGGDEVVQVYICNEKDKHGPIKSLRGFKRVYLNPNEEQLVTIQLPESAFEFYDEHYQRGVIRNGKYRILYGGSSDNKSLKSLTYKLDNDEEIKIL